MTTCDVPELKLITLDDIRAVKNFVREEYMESEPLYQYLNSKECKDFRYFARATAVGEIIKEGLSYMYITKTGQIVAVGLVGMKDTQFPVEHATPLCLKLIPFFEMVEEEVKKTVNVTDANREAMFWILSVHSDWRVKGLAKSIVEKVMSALKFHGFTHVKVFCSSAYSTKLFEKLGFKKLYSIKYNDYAPNGEVIFIPDEPHTHFNFMGIKL